jgi:hypothetical protein
MASVDGTEVCNSDHAISKPAHDTCYVQGQPTLREAASSSAVVYLGARGMPSFR